MYGYVNRLGHTKSKDKTNEGSRGSLDANSNIFQRKRNPAVLFARIEKMSPKLKKLGMALNSGNGGRREWATFHLSHIGKKAGFLLHFTFIHGEPMARAAAVETYCRMKKLGIFDSFSSILPDAVRDDSPYVRWRTLAAASKLGRNGVWTSASSVMMYTSLFNCLDDESDVVRAQAAKAIIATYRWPRTLMIEEDLTKLDTSIRKERSPYVKNEMSLAYDRIEREIAASVSTLLDVIGFKPNKPKRR